MVELLRTPQGHIVADQHWDVVATNQTTIYLLLGGNINGQNVRFAHKHLLSPSRKRPGDSDEKARLRAQKRLEPLRRAPVNQRLNPKEMMVQQDRQLPQPTGIMSRQEKYGNNANGVNTTIFLDIMPLDMVLREIADAILTYDWSPPSGKTKKLQDVQVTFSIACVCNHNSHGRVGAPYNSVRINVMSLDPTGRNFALLHLAS